MTFQISDDEAKKLLDLFGRLKLSMIEEAFEDEDVATLISQSQALVAWKTVDVIFDRLVKAYEK